MHIYLSFKYHNFITMFDLPHIHAHLKSTIICNFKTHVTGSVPTFQSSYSKSPMLFLYFIPLKNINLTYQISIPSAIFSTSKRFGSI